MIKSNLSLYAPYGYQIDEGRCGNTLKKMLCGRVI
jgi:hypothetical protein